MMLDDSDRSWGREPLLRSSTSSVPRNTPPRHAFQIRLRSEASASAELSALDTSSSWHAPRSYVLRTRPATDNDPDMTAGWQWWGWGCLEETTTTTIATIEEGDRILTWGWWGIHIPLSLLLGTVISVSWVGVWTLMQTCQHLVLAHELSFSIPPHDNWSTDPITTWSWPAITTVGGLLAGLIVYWLPAGLEAVDHSYWNAASTAPHWIAILLLLPAGIVVYSTGAPLGPEAVAGALARWWVRSLEAGYLWYASSTSTRRRSSVSSSSPMVASMALSAVATCLFVNVSPILGPLMLWELSAVHSSLGSKEHNQRHPYATMLLNSVASITAYTVMGICFPSVVVIPSQIYTMDQQLMGTDRKTWHVVAAIPMGLVGGMLGVATVSLGRGLLHVRVAASNQWWILSSTAARAMVFPMSAGLVHGILSWMCPYAATTGLTASLHAWNQQLHGTAVLSPFLCLLTGMCRLVSLAVCMSWGLVGGALLPAGVASVFLAMALSGWIPWIPLSLSIPCTIMAMCATACPVPFSLVLLLSVIFPGVNVAAMMMAYISAWMVVILVCGGSGTTLSPPTDGSLPVESLEPDEEQSSPLIEDDPILSDEEILQNVRSAIFGKS
jgi:hypothetical protein